MCGIFGLFQGNLTKKQENEVINILKRRGSDYTGIINEISNNKNGNSNYYIHCLHSIVSHVKQPLIKENKENNKNEIKAKTSQILVYNGEIYNWKQLKTKYNIKAKNDTELLFELLVKNGISIVSELKGMYAFAYDDGNNIYITRDILGIKPLVYSKGAFASEGKLLKLLGQNYSEVNPLEIIIFNKKTNKFSKRKKFFFKVDNIKNVKRLSKEKIKNELNDYLVDSVKKHVDDINDFGILFSGGVDSTLLAMICKKLNKKFTLYTSYIKDKNIRVPPDLIYARKIAKKYNFNLVELGINKDKLENLLPKIIEIIESDNVIKVSVAIPFYLAAERAKKDKKKILLSGLGSEELFAGYQRHLEVLNKKGNVNKECLNGLKELWKRDLYRDDLITMYHTIELRLPFLDEDLINYALSIPAKFKITKNTNNAKNVLNNLDNNSNNNNVSYKNNNSCTKKLILREVALDLGLDEEFAYRKKLGAQYGSNTDKVIEKLSKKNGFKSKREYIESL